MMLRIIHVWLALACSEAASAKTSEIVVLSRTPVALYKQNPSNGNATLSNLSAVLIEDTGWTESRVLEGLRGAASILGQCGIRLPGLTLIRVRTSRQFRDLWQPASRYLASLVQAAQPAVYFVADSRQRPTFAAEAFGLANSRTRPELLHTVWITRQAPDLVETIAHELFHVLANSGEHSSDAENLMHDTTAPGRQHLTQDQCSAMLEEARKNNLLGQQ